MLTKSRIALIIILCYGRYNAQIVGNIRQTSNGNFENESDQMESKEKYLFSENSKCSKECGQELKGPNYGFEVTGGNSSNMPWMVKFSIKENSWLFGSCTGSIINRRFILTAAHCVCKIESWCKKIKKFSDDTKEHIILDQVGSVPGDEPEQMVEVPPDGYHEKLPIKVEMVYILPQRISAYASTPGYSGLYDIALLQLQEDLHFDHLIQPICLPLEYDPSAELPPTETGRFTDEGVKGTVAGYGQLVPFEGQKCLTNHVGKMRFHICKDAGLYKPCKKDSPPEGYTYSDKCEDNCAGTDLYGPFGWCHVELYQGESSESDNPWGFCSQSCAEGELSPINNHALAKVDILPSERCSQLLDGVFESPSANFSPTYELCAGQQHFVNDTDEHILRKVTMSGEVFYLNIPTSGSTGYNPILLKKKDDDRVSGHRLTRLTRSDGLVGGADACKGDSGGPLWVKWDQRATQVGVVSRGEQCGSLNLPGVYSRLLPHVEWIYDITSKFGCYTM